jgi:enterochelin esterase-like enzyme
MNRIQKWLIPLVIIVGILGVVIHVVVSSRGGTLIETGIVESKILEQTMEFSVYLPPGYFSSNDEYPVLYLLHGSTGDHTTYPRIIGAKKIADKAIQSGNAVPMIIVMPKSRGGVYNNAPSGTYSYEDYFFNELIPLIEKDYRVLKNKEGRAIAGHSLGGNGAIRYALTHPTQFQSCSILGAAIDMKELDGGTSYFGEKDSIPDLLRRTADALQSAPPDERPSLVVRFYIDCGKEDGLLSVNEQLHVCMNELDITHEFYQRDGGHTWDYWRQALPFVLEYSFRHMKDSTTSVARSHQ